MSKVLRYELQWDEETHTLAQRATLRGQEHGIKSEQDDFKFYSHFDFFPPLIDKPMKLFVPMQSLKTI